MVESKLETITPARAEELLGHNIDNRNVLKTNVTKLCRIIREGNWKINGDAVRITKSGRVIDGQHRLLAVIETGISIQTFVTTGLDEDVAATIDEGVKRNLSAALKIRGVENNSSVASAVVLHWKQRNEVLSTGAKPSVLEGVQEFEAMPGLASAVAARLHHYKKQWHGSPSAYALMGYEFSEVDADAAADFFERLETATKIEPGSAIHALHRWMSSGNNHRPVSLMAVMIKAWNAYVAGEPVEVMQWRPVGKYAEKFPVIES